MNPDFSISMLNYKQRQLTTRFKRVISLPQDKEHENMESLPGLGIGTIYAVAHIEEKTFPTNILL